MTLNQRITRLEQTLATQHCDCPNSADLSWPGHQPDPHCQICGGQRLIYPLDHHPRKAEPLLRKALPLISKIYDGNTKDFSKLSDQELKQLREALQALANAGPRDLAFLGERSED